MINRNKSNRFVEQNMKRIIVGSLLFLLIFTLYYFSWNSGRASCLPLENLNSAGSDSSCLHLENLQYDDPLVVSCLKKHHMVPSSALPYNLSKPEIVNPSQFGQNVIAHGLLQQKKDGFFIECGALDGEMYSNTLILERNYGWTGLLIEADPLNYQALVLKRRKAWISFSCASPSKIAEKLTLVGVDFGGTSGGVMFKKEISGYDPKRVPVVVQCFPLYTYLLALNQTVVDYFSLDIEGSDFDIVKTIPFDKVIFKVLEVEVGGMGEGKKEVQTYLEERGYILFKYMEPDFIFTHNSVDLSNVNLK